MYNQYLAAAEQAPLHTQAPCAQPPPPPDDCGESKSAQTAAVFSDLGRSLTDRLKNVKIDMDTLIVLIIVWFLLGDGNETDWDELMLIGALLLLGV